MKKRNDKGLDMSVSGKMGDRNERAVFRFMIPWLVLILITGCIGSGCNSTGKDDSDDRLEFMIGQMILVGFRGLEIESGHHIIEDITNRHIGGVVLYEYDVPSKSRPRNIMSPEQLRNLTGQLQSLSSMPLLIGIDQEGGFVNRLKEVYGFPPTVSAQYLGEQDDIELTRYWAGLTADNLKEMGINLNFAPVVDLNTNPDCPVIGHYERSFSADPEVVLRHARVVVEEHHRRNIFCSLKHFPGHGSSTADSHEGFVDITDTWQEMELQPYRDFIGLNLADLVMTAHVYNAHLDPDYPATLSRPVLTGILRNQMAFDGPIITDDMMMGAIEDYYGLETAIFQAVNAGADILIFSNNGREYRPEIARQAVDVILKLVNEGRLSPKRIQRSYQRIMSLKLNLLITNL